MSSTVELGRFGRFAARLLIGQRDGSYFRIESSGNLSSMLPEEVEADVSEITATNQTLLDTNTSQRLTTTDIEALKMQVATGDLDAHSMVDVLIKNSDTFEQKNEFSQIKYVQRKQKKFLRWFVIRRPSVRILCQHFMTRDPRKIMDLRLDILSQMICQANVQAEHGKCLVWDETLGFLSGVLLLKTSNTTQVLNVHPDRQMQVPMIIHFNLDESYRSRLHSLALGALDVEEPEFFEAPGTDPKHLSIQKNRYETRRKRHQLLRSWVSGALFDSLIITTSKSDPLEILNRLTPWLRPSARVVVYSTWRDLLLPAYIELRKNNDFVDVAFSESWLRPYQAAPGRIHPDMNCNGHAGALLSATKIARLELV
ncbi:hypothetical protein PSACC_02753 [Paramicrosporidium saccamoebae]|uniref:tRNA (adenine(58)-N(1))-methyltransferase non-catalytic subunit TRM6 n=1 Tax=Paramicrosporidium saccamoebae TaxID=1246581 RepID=A0A2H9TIL8_9FUNG|nr:hypothetical protein PSACC_02753 [Paramicrosporidium saccamoebae]